MVLSLPSCRSSVAPFPIPALPPTDHLSSKGGRWIIRNFKLTTSPSESNRSVQRCDSSRTLTMTFEVYSALHNKLQCHLAPPCPNQRNVIASSARLFPHGTERLKGRVELIKTHPAIAAQSQRQSAWLVGQGSHSTSPHS